MTMFIIIIQFQYTFPYIALIMYFRDVIFNCILNKNVKWVSFVYVMLKYNVMFYNVTLSLGICCFCCRL